MAMDIQGNVEMDQGQIKSKEAGKHKYFPDNSKSTGIAFSFPFWLWNVSLLLPIGFNSDIIDYETFVAPQFSDQN